MNAHYWVLGTTFLTLLCRTSSQLASKFFKAGTEFLLPVQKCSPQKCLFQVLRIKTGALGREPDHLPSLFWRSKAWLIWCESSAFEASLCYLQCGPWCSQVLGVGGALNLWERREVWQTERCKHWLHCWEQSATSTAAICHAGKDQDLPKQQGSGCGKEEAPLRYSQGLSSSSQF